MEWKKFDQADPSTHPKAGHQPFLCYLKQNGKFYVFYWLPNKKKFNNNPGNDPRHQWRNQPDMYMEFPLP